MPVESSLHRQLKERYGPSIGGRAEVAHRGFRIDAIAPDGRLIEVQSSPLGLLRRKLERLLPTQPVGVVKPIVVGRRVVRRDRAGAEDRPARRSPRRGALIDAFDELVGLARVFPHANLRIDLLAVEIDEVRVPRRGRPGYTVVDRILREVVAAVGLREADDLWSILPDGLPGRFTTDQLADHLGRPVEFARRVAYCLRHAGAVGTVDRRGNRRVYERGAVEPGA